MSKKTTKQAAADQPTRRTIETLLRELSSRDHGYAEYRAACDRADAIANRLSDVPVMRRANAEKEAAGQLWQKRRREFEGQLQKVRRLYWAHGLTPRVVKAVKALVEKANGGAEG